MNPMLTLFAVSGNGRSVAHDDPAELLLEPDPRYPPIRTYQPASALQVPPEVLEQLGLESAERTDRAHRRAKERRARQVRQKLARRANRR